MILALTLTSSLPVHAQSRPAPVVEATAGWAGFLDDSVIEHRLVGVGARAYLLPWLSVGPELTYLAGPGSDRDLFVTGNVMFDVLLARAGVPRRVTPFLLAGGGFLRHSNQFQSGTFSATEGAVTLGLGVRAWLTRRAFVAVDARIGWEPHVRVAGIVGLAIEN